MRLQIVSQCEVIAKTATDTNVIINLVKPYVGKSKILEIEPSLSVNDLITQAKTALELPASETFSSIKIMRGQTVLSNSALISNIGVRDGSSLRIRFVFEL